MINDFLNNVTISSRIADMGLWPLIVFIVPNLFFRKYNSKSAKKRLANLYQAITVFVITTSAAFIADKKAGDKYLFLVIAVLAVLLYIYRKTVFPYKLKCENCGASLDFKTIYFMEKNLCSKCLLSEEQNREQESQEHENSDELPENSEISENKESAEEAEEEKS